MKTKHLSVKENGESAGNRWGQSSAQARYFKFKSQNCNSTKGKAVGGGENSLSLSLTLLNLWSPGNTIAEREAEVRNGHGDLSLSILLSV
jgi:hypothetical protein